MLSNYIVRNRITELKLKKSELSQRQRDIEKQISGLGISYNQVQRRSIYVPEQKWNLRDKWVAELLEIKKQIAPIAEELLELYRKEDAEQNKWLTVIFKEIFTADQMREINAEVKRRMTGEEPTKLTFDVKRSDEFRERYHQHRKLAKEQIDNMIQFRIMLTGLIEKGCEKWGNGEFLKFISPLNKLIIPTQELEKIKRQHLL